MKIGVHLRLSGGREKAIRTAMDIGCECIQIFAANPNSWHSPEINLDEAEKFRSLAVEYDIQPVVIHTPYLLNLASSDPVIYEKSIYALIDSMHRADKFGASYVVTHIGSHKGAGMEQGIANVVRGVSRTLDAVDNEVVLLLENSAGGGDSVGSKFDQIHSILDAMDGYENRLGVCLDMAHLWGAGYDVSCKDAVDQTIGDFISTVGLSWLKVLHLNDTHVELGSRRDRHANIGTGLIGEPGFAAILHHPALTSLVGIIETPARTLEDDERDIDILKRLRGDLGFGISD